MGFLLTLVMVCSVLPLSPLQVVQAAADGFYTSGTSVYDANGNKFIMRGVNIAHAWYTSETETSIKAAASRGANCVRIVCSDGKQYTKTTASELENIISICKANKVVCILDVHDTTGSDSSSDLDAAVEYWKEMKSILDANKKYVIVNIANEWCGCRRLGNFKRNQHPAVVLPRWRLPEIPVRKVWRCLYHQNKDVKLLFLS